jgi:translocation and assembly module TamB
LDLEAMKQHLGRTLVLVAAGLLAGLLVLMRTDWAGEKVCAQARARLPALLGADVAIDRCSIDPLRGGVELHGARLRTSGLAEPLFMADRIFVRLGALELFSRRLRLSRVELDQPQVRLSLGDEPAAAPGRSTVTPKATCFLDELERIEVDSLSVNGGELHLSEASGRGLDLEGIDLELRLKGRTYGVKLSIPRGGIQTGRVTLPLSRLRLSGSLDLALQKLAVKQLELAAGEVSVTSRGEVETVCDPSLALEASVHAPLDLVTALFGPGAPRMSGAAQVTIKKAEGTLRDPIVEAEVSFEHAQVEQFEIGNGLIEARLEKDRVRVDKLELEVGEGRVRAQASLGLGRELPISGSVELVDVEFGRVLDQVGVKRPWVNFGATGKVGFSGTLVPFLLTAPTSIDARDFRVWDRPFDAAERQALLQFDRAHVDLTADFDGERAHLGKARIRTDHSDVEADARLYYDPLRGMDIDAQLNDVDLADLGHIVGIPWDGHLAGRATLRIQGPQVRIRGHVSARDFKFHKLNLGAVETAIDLKGQVLAFSNLVVARGRSRFAADGELDFRRGGPYGRGRGAFENARLSDLVEMVGDEHWIFDLVRRRMEARISGNAVVDGKVSGPRSLIHVALQDATYFERRIGAGDFVFRSEDGERVFIDRLDFDGPCGRIGFGGRVDLSSGMEFHLHAPELNVSELFKPDAQFVGAKGALSVEARLYGPPDHTQMTGTVIAKELAAFGVDLGSGTLALTLDRTDLRLQGPVGKDFLVDGRMVVQGDMPFAIGVSASTSDLGHYVPSEPGLSGRLVGELFATGTIDRYLETRGDIGVSALELKRGDFAAQNDGPLALAFSGRAMEIRSFRLKGLAGTRLTATGLKDGEGNLDVSLDGRFDARFLEDFTSFQETLEQAAGAVQVHATVSGRLDKPTVVGTADLESVRFNVKGYPVSAKAVKGRLEFSQNKLYLAGVEGAVNGGAVVVRGDVEMKDFATNRVDLGAHLDQVQYRYQDAPATFTGDLHLAGPLTNLLLTGEVDLARLRYTQDLDLETVLKDLRRRHLEARSFEKRDEFLRYDVALNVREDARVENNLVRASLKGRLQIVGTNAHMGAIGTLTSLPGGRAFYRDNELLLTRVAIEFTERDRIAELIDLYAEGQVRDYKVMVHAFGPLEEPQVDLTSDPALPRSDVFTLLTLGVTRGDAGGYSTGAGVGVVGETILNIAGLDKRFQRFLPKNSVIRAFNFHISTQYSEVSGIVEPTAQFESRFWTDALKLRLSQPMISGRGRRAQAEYRFDDHTSAQVQWDNESTDSSIGDLGLDLKLRWERE